MINITKDQWIINRRILQQKLNTTMFTQEQRLDSLGKFPLPKSKLTALTEEIQYEGNIFIVPKLLQQSNIPIYFPKSNDLQLVLIPTDSLPICRYFYETWFSETNIEKIADISFLKDVQKSFKLNDESTEYFLGFLVIQSFIGDGV